MARSPLTAWQTLVLRLTAFLGPEPHPIQPSWWSDLVGTPPEKVVVQPKMGVGQQEGPYAGGNLNLQVAFDRADWSLTPKIEPSEEFLEPPSLGSFPDITNVFVKLMNQWLTISPQVTRL